MGVFEQLAFRIVLRYLEGIVTPEAVDGAEAQAVAFIKAQAAKTPTKVDDKIVAAVLAGLDGEAAKAVEAELVALGDAFVAGTPTDYDDQIWAVLKKAL